MYPSTPRRLFAGTIALAGPLFVSVPGARGAVLSGSYTDGAVATPDLTTQGTTDWAIWNTTTSPYPSGAPTNRKSGGSGIGNVDALVNADPRGAGGTGQTFSYTDGQSPASQTNATFGFITDSQLEQVGAGVTLTITGTAGVENVARVYVGMFDSVGQLTASLPGASNYVQASGAGDSTGTKDPGVYTLNFTPDNAGDLLTVRFEILSDIPDTNGSSNVGISAVTLSAVPEPSALAAAGSVAAAGLLRRRRTRD